MWYLIFPELLKITRPSKYIHPSKPISIIPWLVHSQNSLNINSLFVVIFIKDSLEIILIHELTILDPRFIFRCELLLDSWLDFLNLTTCLQILHILLMNPLIPSIIINHQSLLIVYVHYIFTSLNIDGKSKLLFNQLWLFLLSLFLG